ncbi:MAG: ribonuclease P protein component [Ignavibacteria bacterium]|nr:ribonuclease P protein component [Ignavibacteria bacterium]
MGFIIAKKKIRKSYFRNRIRRLLKESYRLNRQQTGFFSLKLNIIFSLTEKGYEHFRNNPKTKFNFVDSEMKLLQEKIQKK